jgi:hypothetical protein
MTMRWASSTNGLPDIFIFGEKAVNGSVETTICVDNWTRTTVSSTSYYLETVQADTAGYPGSGGTYRKTFTTDTAGTITDVTKWIKQ